MQRAFALYAALVDKRYPISIDLIEQRIYRDDGRKKKNTQRTAKQEQEWFKTAFKRDRALLKDLGIHIIHVEDARGTGYLIDPKSSFARSDFALELDESTSAFLYLALTGFINDPLFPLPRDLRLAHLRLTNLWSTMYGDDMIAAISNRLPDELPEAQSRFAELMLMAILQSHKVDLTYENQRDEKSRRTLSPYGLSFVEGRWYVIGHDSNSDALRYFALSRIVDADLMNETFEFPDDFDISEHIALPFALSGTTSTDTVTLVIEPDQAAHAKAITRDKGTLEQQEDGSLVWTVEYGDIDRLERFIIENQLTFSDPDCVCARELDARLEKIVLSHR
ncbi:MAG: WYL domain-containing protein [Coriobacteriia bacterium]|nr:WYL domain-containing protein [Coriobacteriia bacterium]